MGKLSHSHNCSTTNDGKKVVIGTGEVNKSLQTAKIEELLNAYEDCKEIVTNKDGRFWVKTIIKDLKWLLDDETY